MVSVVVVLVRFNRLGAGGSDKRRMKVDHSRRHGSISKNNALFLLFFIIICLSYFSTYIQESSHGRHFVALDAEGQQSEMEYKRDAF